jgi:fumarylacetoacetase
MGHAAFPLQNLPLGVFVPPGGGQARGGTAIGGQLLDLAAVAALLTNPLAQQAAVACAAPTLNAVLALGAAPRRALRHALFALLTDARQVAAVTPHLYPAASCVLQLPAAIGDYTDFFTGLHHAMNVGRLFRPDSPLLPNYKHVPIGYHGRASSVRASGEPVRRPLGQSLPRGATEPLFGPSRRLDYELEMGLWVGAASTLGEPVPMAQAEEYLAGLCLLNDWSARDLQAWESQPLGPFLAKSFHTSVSPWIITLEALAPFREPLPARAPGDPAPLPYLTAAPAATASGFAVTMEAFLSTPAMRAAGLPAQRLARSSLRAMYWSAAQLVAHHTSNGCNLRPGDLFGTGTLSGDRADSLGCLLEMTEGGQVPLALPGGETRTFLEDGDEVVFAAHASAPGYISIGFGTCQGRIAPALAFGR